MSQNSSHFKLPTRPKLAQIRIDEVLEYGEECKAGWQKRKELARGSVINLFKTARSNGRRSEQSVVEEERLGPRPVSRRTKAPAKSSVPIAAALDISDDVLDRLTSEPSTLANRPTSKFFSNQRRRAGIESTHGSRSIPMAQPSQAEMDRTPLDAEDIVYMFAGAPYFGVRDHAGRRQPQITFGWGPTSSEGQDATDYIHVKHKTFTLRTTDTTNRPASVQRGRQVREIPSMLSADGKDPGAIGLTHFLELPLQQTYPELAATQQQVLFENPESVGLREFDIENVVDRLAELSKVYDMLRRGKGEAAEWDQRMIEEIGEDLFLTLLSADLGTTPAGTGSVSLRTQILALQKVLKTEPLWYDFADESWRLRLSQVLWQPLDIHNNGHNERDVLMLQIALSAELAVRMEIANRLSATNFRSSAVFTQEDLDAITEEQVERLDWDIVVFQRFVLCFEATSSPPGAPSPLKRLSFVGSADESTDDIPTAEPNLVFQLRNEQEQWHGLHAFASSVNWPDLTSSKTQPALPQFDSFLTPPANGRPSSYVSEYDTPLTSPVVAPVPTGTPALILIRSQKMLLPHSAFDEISPGTSSTSLTWATKAWLSGFIMPGTSVDQFLLHALLETSPDTTKLLAESLNMNDGLVHRRQMYWSKDSVAGRVLAPCADAKECTGWISLPFVPQGQGDGWIRALVKDAPYAAMEPRINTVDLISRTSDPLRSKDASTLQSGDFATVLDGHMIMGNEAQFEGVSLSSSNVVQYIEDGFIVPKTINLTFRSPRNTKMPALTLPLTHAVYFVSSYPCYPYTKRKANGTSLAHDSHAPTDSGHSSPSSHVDKDLPLPPAHPLHVDYTYTIIPAAALLSSEMPAVKDSDSLVLISSPDDEQPSIYQIEDQEVIVLDCRGSSDLEVLARAWSAKVGENALVGRSGRTCLACCIREAVGLGIGVVLRTS